MVRMDYCDSDESIIEIYYNEEFIQVDKINLFKYVQDNDLNYWIDNFFDPKESDAGERTGYHSFEQYFNLPFDSIKDDILQFIKKVK